MKPNKKSAPILELIRARKSLRAPEIYKEINLGESTIRKYLKQLVDENLVITKGVGKATYYSISPSYELLAPVDLDQYYAKDANDRSARESFNHDLIPTVLQDAELFTNQEFERLAISHDKYKKSVESVDAVIYMQRLEVLTIDLIWKSSEIEGNTYSLLETEALIKQNELAEGKSKEEATMLLNHKKALDFILSDLGYIKSLTLQKTIMIHDLLTAGLGIKPSIRSSGVGITGTNYRPLNLETQIMEAVEQMIGLVHNRENPFEKALLLLALLSYIQAFNDGNKRTARIVSNAVLMSEGYCPLSFRPVKSVDYKKAMLLFYEQNNITALKKMFIEQHEYAVDKYFDL